MSAAELLAEAREAGVELSFDDGVVQIRAARPPPAWLLNRLRAHRAELIPLLRGTTRPHWTEVDYWRARQREAMGNREGRAAVLREWAAAAGGTVDQDGHLELPPNLRGCLALAELHALARGMGFLR